MNKSLLDTDILSEINKARDREIVAAAARYLTQYPCFTISTVTVMEIVRGYHHSKRPEQLDAFLTSLSKQETLAFLKSTAVLSGQIAADLQSSGQPIGRADPMIAATAIEHGLVLVTGNTNHFARIQAMGYPLLLDNWRSSATGSS